MTDNDIQSLVIELYGTNVRFVFDMLLLIITVSKFYFLLFIPINHHSYTL